MFNVKLKDALIETEATIVWHSASEWVVLANRQDSVSLHAEYEACRFCCSTLLSGSHSQLCNKILTRS